MSWWDLLDWRHHHKRVSLTARPIRSAHARFALPKLNERLNFQARVLGTGKPEIVRIPQISIIGSTLNYNLFSFNIASAGAGLGATLYHGTSRLTANNLSASADALGSPGAAIVVVHLTASNIATASAGVGATALNIVGGNTSNLVATSIAAGAVGFDKPALQATLNFTSGEQITLANVGRAGAAALNLPNYSSSLTVQSGTVTISASGTYRNINFTGPVFITGGTVLFEFCKFSCQPAQQTGAVRVYNAGNFTGNVVFNYCDWDSGWRGNQGTNECDGFECGSRATSDAPTFNTASSFKLYRCTFQGYGNLLALHKWQNNSDPNKVTGQSYSEVTECYMGNAVYGSATHVDLIEWYSADNIYVQRNSLNGDGANNVFTCIGIDVFTNLANPTRSSPTFPLMIKSNFLNGAAEPFRVSEIAPQVQAIYYIDNRLGDSQMWGFECDFYNYNVTYNFAYAQANPKTIYWEQTNVWSSLPGAVTNPATGTGGAGEPTAGLPHVVGAFVTPANFASIGDAAWGGTVVGPTGTVLNPSNIVVQAAGLGQPSVNTRYVSNAGSDANDGLSSNTPWATIAKVNSVTYPPGADILFQGGQTFSGAIVASSSGVTGNSISYGSYGVGQATISSGNSSPGFTATNKSNISVSGLTFVGGGTASSTTPGVLFDATVASVKQSNINVDHCIIFNYGASGILVRGAASGAGFNNVTINNNTVHDCTAHATDGIGDNGGTNAGVNVFGFTNAGIVHSNVTINFNTIYNCPGFAGSADNTGNIIQFAEVQTGLAFGNYGHDCGTASTIPPCGLMVWNSDSITLSSNEIARFGSSDVEAGIDLDENATNCLVEYNYIHECGGANITSYTVGHSGNVWRYNLTQNSNYSEVYLAALGACTEHWYNNVFINTVNKPIINDQSGGSTGYTGIWANNIFYQGAANKFIIVTTNYTMTWINNDWYGPTATGFTFNGNFATVAAWGKDSAAVTTNPSFSGPVPRPTGQANDLLGNTHNLTNYTTLKTSPMIDVGLNLVSQYGFNVGTQDFYGNAIPDMNGKYSIGAYQLLTLALVSSNIASASAAIGTPTLAIQGAFSDADRPSLANRPVTSNATNVGASHVLTWVGPSGGGANNGSPVQQSRTLTPGTINVTGNNQVIQGLYHTGEFAIGNDDTSLGYSNVTIKQCCIYVNNAGANDNAIQISALNNNLIIEDCEIFGTGLSMPGGVSLINIGKTVASGSITIRRCHIHDTGQHGIHIESAPSSGNTLLIQDDYMHDIQSSNNSGSGTDHFDGIYFGGGNPGQITIDHSVILNNDGWGQTSAIFCEGFFGTLQNITLSNSWFWGGGYPVYVTAKQYAIVGNIKILNNAVGGGVWGPTGTTGVPDYPFDINGTVTASGNVYLNNITTFTTGPNIDSFA